MFVTGAIFVATLIAARLVWMMLRHRGMAAFVLIVGAVIWGVLSRGAAP